MENNYKEKLDELVDFGLSEGSCVLFIGPEFIKFDEENKNTTFGSQP